MSDNNDLHLPLPRLVEIAFAAGAHRIVALTDEPLHDACGVRIAFTQRTGGASAAPYASLNLGTHVDDELQAVQENRSRVLEAFGAAACSEALVTPNQVHGTELVIVGDVDEARARVQEGADGVVCGQGGVPVLLCFADCVPVIVVAPGGAFAVAHAGWRGALGGIPGKALEQLAFVAGCEPAACNAYIGPHIGACCYEVSEELLERFERAYGPACRAGTHLDLEAAVSASLVRAGAVPERIAGSGVCTSCNTEAYYSYRAEGGVCGRHGAFAYKEM